MKDVSILYACMHVKLLLLCIGVFMREKKMGGGGENYQHNNSYVYKSITYPLDVAWGWMLVASSCMIFFFKETFWITCWPVY